ncbi:unnamed protein product [Amoebophrya sp. A25]|nr:unnamed protein product [Amoebophrya sp. A25]|eukprot:GSA25T00016549001.1
MPVNELLDEKTEINQKQQKSYGDVARYSACSTTNIDGSSRNDTNGGSALEKAMHILPHRARQAPPPPPPPHALGGYQQNLQSKAASWVDLHDHQQAAYTNMTSTPTSSGSAPPAHHKQQGSAAGTNSSPAQQHLHGGAALTLGAPADHSWAQYPSAPLENYNNGWLLAGAASYNQHQDNHNTYHGRGPAAGWVGYGSSSSSSNTYHHGGWGTAAGALHYNSGKANYLVPSATSPPVSASSVDANAEGSRLSYEAFNNSKKKGKSKKKMNSDNAAGGKSSKSGAASSSGEAALPEGSTSSSHHETQAASMLNKAKSLGAASAGSDNGVCGPWSNRSENGEQYTNNYGVTPHPVPVSNKGQRQYDYQQGGHGQHESTSSTPSRNSTFSAGGAGSWHQPGQQHQKPLSRWHTSTNANTSTNWRQKSWAENEAVDEHARSRYQHTTSRYTHQMASPGTPDASSGNYAGFNGSSPTPESQWSSMGSRHNGTAGKPTGGGQDQSRTPKGRSTSTPEGNAPKGSPLRPISSCSPHQKGNSQPNGEFENPSKVEMKDTTVFTGLQVEEGTVTISEEKLHTPSRTPADGASPTATAITPGSVRVLRRNESTKNGAPGQKDGLIMSTPPPTPSDMMIDADRSRNLDHEDQTSMLNQTIVKNIHQGDGEPSYSPGAAAGSCSTATASSSTGGCESHDAHDESKIDEPLPASSSSGATSNAVGVQPANATTEDVGNDNGTRISARTSSRDSGLPLVEVVADEAQHQAPSEEKAAKAFLSQVIDQIMPSPLASLPQSHAEDAEDAVTCNENDHLRAAAEEEDGESLPPQQADEDIKDKAASRENGDRTGVDASITIKTLANSSLPELTWSRSAPATVGFDAVRLDDIPTPRSAPSSFSSSVLLGCHAGNKNQLYVPITRGEGESASSSTSCSARSGTTSSTALRTLGSASSRSESQKLRPPSASSDQHLLNPHTRQQTLPTSSTTHPTFSSAAFEEVTGRYRCGTWAAPAPAPVVTNEPPARCSSTEQESDDAVATHGHDGEDGENLRAGEQLREGAAQTTDGDAAVPVASLAGAVASNAEENQNTGEDQATCVDAPEVASNSSNTDDHNDAEQKRDEQRRSSAAPSLSAAAAAEDDNVHHHGGAQDVVNRDASPTPAIGPIPSSTDEPSVVCQNRIVTGSLVQLDVDEASAPPSSTSNTAGIIPGLHEDAVMLMPGDSNENRTEEETSTEEQEGNRSTALVEEADNKRSEDQAVATALNTTLAKDEKTPERTAADPQVLSSATVADANISVPEEGPEAASTGKSAISSSSVQVESKAPPEDKTGVVSAALDESANAESSSLKNNARATPGADAVGHGGEGSSTDRWSRGQLKKTLSPDFDIPLEATSCISPRKEDESTTNQTGREGETIVLEKRASARSSGASDEISSLGASPPEVEDTEDHDEMAARPPSSKNNAGTSSASSFSTDKKDEIPGTATPTSSSCSSSSSSSCSTRSQPKHTKPQEECSSSSSSPTNIVHLSEAQHADVGGKVSSERHMRNLQTSTSTANAASAQPQAPELPSLAEIVASAAPKTEKARQHLVEQESRSPTVIEEEARVTAEMERARNILLWLGHHATPPTAPETTKEKASTPIARRNLINTGFLKKGEQREELHYALNFLGQHAYELYGPEMEQKSIATDFLFLPPPPPPRRKSRAVQEREKSFIERHCSTGIFEKVFGAAEEPSPVAAKRRSSGGRPKKKEEEGYCPQQ